MTRKARRFPAWRLVYLLVVLLLAVLLYWLIPKDVIDAVRATYFSKNPGEF